MAAFYRKYQIFEKKLTLTAPVLESVFYSTLPSPLALLVQPGSCVHNGLLPWHWQATGLFATTQKSKPSRAHMVVGTELVAQNQVAIQTLWKQEGPSQQSWALILCI